MPCSVRRVIMGSYLHIHLSMFPIYILIVFLTLSHARSSAKMRETLAQLIQSHKPHLRHWIHQSADSVSVNHVYKSYSNDPLRDQKVISFQTGGKKDLSYSQIKESTDYQRLSQDDEEALDFLPRDDTQLGSQLDTFRQNILQSLGHARDIQPNINNVTLNYNDENSLAKYNITKGEYLQAYMEYLSKVKQRKVAARGYIGANIRRKNAVTNTKTYYHNGTDLFSIGSQVFKLFHFDIHFAPKMENTKVRFQRVVLTMPATCQLLQTVQNNTDPNLQTIPSLSLMTNDENGNETQQQFIRVDITRNVTEWSVRYRHSSQGPFLVLATCSQSELSSYKPAPHHVANLRVVTAETLNPSLEALLNRRTRRSAPRELSTLRSLTHKTGTRGRECANTRHGKTCCRRSLPIKFSDLGISDVILEPKEFDAHVCDGRCNAKRVAYTSTHAMFQHILHQTKGKQFAPRPCCVPTSLTELDVLHLDPSGNRNGGPKLIVTILKDVIVKECGCS